MPYIKRINITNIIKEKTGVYTKFQADAEKLAYAFGGYKSDKERMKNEIHDIRKGYGYYPHYHPILIETHIWYGGPR